MTQPIQVPVTAMDLRTKRNWTIQAGMMLTYEPGTAREETVQARLDSTGALVADFRKNHPAGVQVVVYGNPGPWERYDHRVDPCVLHFEVID